MPDLVIAPSPNPLDAQETEWDAVHILQFHIALPHNHSYMRWPPMGKQFAYLFNV
jgi:hypothetical protein